MKKKYKVWLRSIPGPYAQYNGHVEVMALDEEGAETAALSQLKRGCYPDRNNSMWRIEKIERQY